MHHAASLRLPSPQLHPAPLSVFGRRQSRSRTYQPSRGSSLSTPLPRVLFPHRYTHIPRRRTCLQPRRPAGSPARRSHTPSPPRTPRAGCTIPADVATQTDAPAPRRNLRCSIDRPHLRYLQPYPSRRPVVDDYSLLLDIRQLRELYNCATCTSHMERIVNDYGIREPTVTTHLPFVKLPLGLPVSSVSLRRQWRDAQSANQKRRSPRHRGTTRRLPRPPNLLTGLSRRLLRRSPIAGYVAEREVAGGCRGLRSPQLK